VTALAVAPAAEPAGYEQQVTELVDLETLVARGLDLSRLRFVPAPIRCSGTRAARCVAV